MTANDIQIGGDHYKNSEGVQHWDWVVANLGVGYLMGNATKYVSRWRSKNGIPDLEKAGHYVAKLLECAENGFKNTVQHNVNTDELAVAYGLDEVETLVCELIMYWKQSRDLEAAADMIEKMIAQAQAELDQFPEGWDQLPDEAKALVASVAEGFGQNLSDVQIMHIADGMTDIDPTGMEHPFGYDAEEELGGILEDDSDEVVLGKDLSELDLLQKVCEQMDCVVWFDPMDEVWLLSINPTPEVVADEDVTEVDEGNAPIFFIDNLNIYNASQT